MGPGTGQGAPSRATPMDTLRQLAGSIMDGVYSLPSPSVAIQRDIPAAVERNLPAIAELILGALPGSGDVMAARDATDYSGRTVQSLREGRYGDAAGNAGVTALAAAGVLPFLPNLVGGIKAFHGSPSKELSVISAAPTNRQFDNATSQFGAFFSPTADGARRYSGPDGRVYEADLPLKKPYEMSWAEFSYFQSPQKARDGSALPGEKWADRLEELKQEAAALRARLVEQGYDGVFAMGRSGPIEIATFSDVRLPAKSDP